MLSGFGNFEYAGTEATLFSYSSEGETIPPTAYDEEGNITSPASSTAKKVALLNDPSSHGGSIAISNQDGTVIVEGKEVAVYQATHICPIEGHWSTPITIKVDDNFLVNGKKVVLDGSIAGCGAKIKASTTKTFGAL